MQNDLSVLITDHYMSMIASPLKGNIIRYDLLPEMILFLCYDDCFKTLRCGIRRFFCIGMKLIYKLENNVILDRSVE